MQVQVYMYIYKYAAPGIRVCVRYDAEQHTHINNSPSMQVFTFKQCIFNGIMGSPNSLSQRHLMKII